MDRQTLGKEAEKKALKYLQSQGLKILKTNYLCRLGEIDLIALDNNTLVFVEVRSRSYQQWGGALASVNRSKQRKLIKTAAYFLANNSAFSNTPCRFDLVTFDNKPHSDTGDSCPVWYKDAFRPEATF